MATLLRRITIASFLLLACAHFAEAKMDASFGYFSLTAKTSKGSGSVAGLGTYQFMFRKEVFQHIELGIGYSVSIEKTISGDMSFGPDLGAYYYPFTSTNGYRAETAETLFISSETWKPYGGLSFHQRQYQSTSSSYAGFGFSLGTEYFWDRKLSFKGELRTLNLSGPAGAKATETNLLFGIIFGN